MPELPDVEAQRRVLARHATGRQIRSISAPAPEVLRNTTPAALGRALHGRRLATPHRHGKWLTAPTEGGARVVFHFGMSGRLVPADRDEPLHPHDRVVMRLDRGELRMRTMRKLGGVWRARSDEELTAVTGPLGPDAWGIDEATLRDRIGARRGGIKPALMDQRNLAGLGNLLVDELLWRTCVHPRTPAADVEGWPHLAATLQEVLQVAV